MPNVDELIDKVSQIVTAKTQGALYFTLLDLKYAYSQHRLTAESAKQCNFNITERLAVVWSVDRFKHYLPGKEFILATDHKALTSALGEHKSNKTYQSRLTRLVDRLLLYQFKVVHTPWKDMGIVEYLSRDPIGGPWPESELDKKFVVALIDQFHAALDCLNSRLSDTNTF